MAIDSLINESSVVVSFKASDDALIHWLDMSSEVWCEVLDAYILKTTRNNMTCEIILQEKCKRPGGMVRHRTPVSSRTGCDIIVEHSCV